MHEQRNHSNFKRHNQKEVLGAILTFYLVAVLFGARHLFNWSSRLPVSVAVQALQFHAKAVWRWTASLGLDAPSFLVEQVFQSAQETTDVPGPKTQAIREGKSRVAKLTAKSAPPKKTASVGQSAIRTARQRETNVEPKEIKIPRKSAPQILIAGDSIMLTVGPAIKADVDRVFGGQSEVIAKLSTGLARPDVFDWREALLLKTQARTYDHIIMLLGTNDSQDFSEDGATISYGTSAWSKTYVDRLAALMALVCKKTPHAIWLGLPPMRSSTFNKKASHINTLVQTEAKHHECIEFVPLNHVIGDAQGRFATYLQVLGRLEKIRTTDGIHITARGGALISSTLMPRLAGKQTIH